MVNVREKSLEEIENKLSTMNTALNKINYLETAVKDSSFTLEIKRFLLNQLSELYSERKMYERAGKAMSVKAALEITFRDKMNSYITAAELYCKAQKVEDAEQMFTMAIRDVDNEQKNKIKLARKNLYFKMAQELESSGKKASATKFYEKLIKMNLDELEKNQVKAKLLATYKSLGMFREAKLVEGL